MEEWYKMTIVRIKVIDFVPTEDIVIPDDELKNIGLMGVNIVHVIRYTSVVIYYIQTKQGAFKCTVWKKKYREET